MTFPNGDEIKSGDKKPAGSTVGECGTFPVYFVAYEFGRLQFNVRMFVGRWCEIIFQRWLFFNLQTSVRGDGPLRLFPFCRFPSRLILPFLVK